MSHRPFARKHPEGAWGAVFLVSGLALMAAVLVAALSPSAGGPWVLLFLPMTAFAGYRICRAFHPWENPWRALGVRVQVFGTALASGLALLIAGSAPHLLLVLIGIMLVAFLIVGSLSASWKHRPLPRGIATRGGGRSPTERLRLGCTPGRRPPRSPATARRVRATASTRPSDR